MQNGVSQQTTHAEQTGYNIKDWETLVAACGILVFRKSSVFVKKINWNSYLFTL